MLIAKKTDALKSPPAHFDPASVVKTRLKIGEIQGVWTSVTSVNFGEHSLLQIRAFSGVENSIFVIELGDFFQSRACSSALAAVYGEQCKTPANI